MKHLLLGALMVLLVGGWSVSGETYVVNPEGTGDFPTIQAAISAAADGDTIELTDGVFGGHGNRDINFLGKSIVVHSRHGADGCIIDCDGWRGFSFVSGEDLASVLAGVTITRASHTWGGGVHCDASSPTITDCAFVENASPGSEGGGLCCVHAARPHVTGCTFWGNVAAHGGGVTSCFSAFPTFEGCTFVANLAQQGGGIRL